MSMVKSIGGKEDRAEDLTGQAIPFCVRSQIRFWRKDTYLLELVRYIHLNPLRAKIVKSLTEADKYPYSGHSALMRKIQREFQDTDYVLRLFGEKVFPLKKFLIMSILKKDLKIF